MKENGNEIIKEYVRDHGLCADWEKEWDTSKGIDDPELYDRLFRGMIWSSRYGENWPPKEFLIDTLGEENFNKHGIYFDIIVYGNTNEDGRHISSLHKAMLVGDCGGVIHYTDGKAHHLYIRNSTNVSVFASNGSLVNIMAYDNSYAYAVKKDKSSKIFASLHGEKSKVTICDVTNGTEKERTGTPKSTSEKMRTLWYKVYFRLRGLKHRICKRVF